MEFIVNAKIVGLVSLLLCAGGASATPSFESTVARPAIAPEDSGLSLPSGFVLREIFRIYRPATNTHVTHFYWPENWEDIGYKYEGTLGFISATPFENSALIRNCVGPHSWNYFTSLDPNCEASTGGVVLPGDWNLGYISTVQIPGSVPLYRCGFVWQGKIRHFDSRDFACEGVGGTGAVLGYVFL